ncbi:MAG: hypothetical protein ABSB42_19080, partial [Tepidisphaeraceae bacterium]
CLSSAFLRRLSSGGLVAGRRLSPCPHLVASHGLSHSESRTPLSGAFSFFAGHFRARQRIAVYPPASEIPLFFEIVDPLIHRFAQLLAGQGKWR